MPGFCVDFWETEMIEYKHKQEGAGIPATMRVKEKFRQSEEEKET